MRLSHQVFAISFVVTAVALSLVGAHTVEEFTKILNRQALHAMQNRVDREAQSFETITKTMYSDLTILAATDIVQRLPSTWVPYARETIEKSVENLFSSILLERPHYAQLRLLGPDGRELVRVNQGPEGIKNVPDDQLQNKKDRPYFQKSSQLSTNQIYVSTLDLNQEHGQVTNPPQPVLRASIPVIDRAGVMLGVIVVNLDVNHVIKGFSKSSYGEEVVLLNMDGDYLFQRDPGKTFGFEKGQLWRLPSDHGLENEWDAYVHNNEGSSATHFLTDSHFIALQKVRLRSPGTFPESPYLFLGLRDSLERFAAQRATMREHFWITLAIICVLLAFVLGFITHVITRPLRTLTETTQRITDGDQDLRADVGGSLEVRHLSSHLNTMLEALKRTARDKEMATLGRMAAMIAHDLRNALSSVKVNLQVLARHQPREDRVQTERFDIALEQVAMMEKVLQEILVFARAESLQTTLEEPASILRATIITVMPLAVEKDINLETQGLESLPAIECDRTKLIQVFRNLIDNAIAVSPDGGKVAIQGSLISTDFGMMINIQISDQGPGIDPDVAETLFEPFVTTRARGTGLGLAIVKRVVGLHEGTVTIENNHPGAKATVTLPVRQTIDKDDKGCPVDEPGDAKSAPHKNNPQDQLPVAARSINPAE